MDSDPSIMSLCSLGLIMGIVHVISGADHICVITAISVNGSWRAFWLGVRWALGHSTGLLLVAIIFLCLKGSIDLDLLEEIGTIPVGFVMLFLGIWVIWKACQDYSESKKKLMKTDSHDELDILEEGDKTEFLKGCEKSDGFIELHEKEKTTSFCPPSPKAIIESVSTFHISSQQKFCDSIETKPTPLQLITTTTSTTTPDKTIIIIKEPISPANSKSNFHNTKHHKFLAFLVGIFAGVAGPGGVLGVLPAVLVTQVHKSLIYLFSFFFSSTILMGLLAASYGVVTQKFASNDDRLVYYMTLFSGCISLVGGLFLLCFEFSKKF
eukprot:c12074_g1_i1.p1 GENE.c12074_g1_i1~~c12074_g1_i1.p1  ORF type:complete len:324 (-),score=105.33 c12074_g1_i1:4-975(-)